MNKKDDNNLNLTMQQRFNFESNGYDEEDTKAYRIKRKQNVVRSKREKELLILKNKYKKKYEFLLFFVLILFFLLLGIVLAYVFVKPKEVEVLKIQEKRIVDENILFLGDSITHRYDLDKYYQDYNVVNSGTDSNITDDILNDIKNRAFVYNPSKVILLIGTNDLQMGKTPEEVVDNIKKIIDSIREKRRLSTFYIESIYPVIEGRPNAGKRKNQTIKDTNELIKKYCSENKIKYINMYDELKNDDDELKEEYTKDGLHMSDEGYEVITKKIKEILK